MANSKSDQPVRLRLVQVTLLGRRAANGEAMAITSVIRLESGRYDAARYIHRAVALATLCGMDPATLADIRALTSNGSTILPHHGGDISLVTAPEAGAHLEHCPSALQLRHKSHDGAARPASIS